jgi:GNAT superfamily N-acetyltransferase
MGSFDHSYFDVESAHSIGIWQEDDTIVAVATYEDKPGSAYLFIDPCYNFLRKEMISYAKKKLSREGKFRVLIPDWDRDFQRVASQLGFMATTKGEEVAVIDIIEGSTDYTLPSEYTIQSVSEECDLYKLNRLMWRGGNHEGEAPAAEEDIRGRRLMAITRPHINTDLNIIVVAPDGEYASYCGMWHLPDSDYAQSEPVATDPSHRRKGLGRAAVLEGVKRCGALGAQQAYVGSSQQFYYSIGFSPLPGLSWWEERA